MGGTPAKIPPNIERMSPSNKVPEVDIEYCGAWGGLPEANHVKKMVLHVYPQAKINLHTPGKTKNLVITVNGKKIYNKQQDGSLNDEKS